MIADQNMRIGRRGEQGGKGNSTGLQKTRPVSQEPALSFVARLRSFHFSIVTINFMEKLSLKP